MAAAQFQQLHAYLDQQIIGQHALTKSLLTVSYTHLTLPTSDLV